MAPWFVRPPGTRLSFRATARFTHDDRCLPVHAAASDGLDGGEEVFLGLDTHFSGWDGTARIAWPGVALTMTATGALATNLQVYAPAGPGGAVRRAVLARAGRGESPRPVQARTDAGARPW